MDYNEYILKHESNSEAVKANLGTLMNIIKQGTKRYIFLFPDLFLMNNIGKKLGFIKDRISNMSDIYIGQIEDDKFRSSFYSVCLKANTSMEELSKKYDNINGYTIATFERGGNDVYIYVEVYKTEDKVVNEDNSRSVTGETEVVQYEGKCDIVNDIDSNSVVFVPTITDDIISTIMKNMKNVKVIDKANDLYDNMITGITRGVIILKDFDVTPNEGRVITELMASGFKFVAGKKAANTFIDFCVANFFMGFSFKLHDTKARTHVDAKKEIFKPNTGFESSAVVYEG